MDDKEVLELVVSAIVANIAVSSLSMNYEQQQRRLTAWRTDDWEQHRVAEGYA
jgi:hypothetical protein